MASVGTVRAPSTHSPTIRRWVSRAFIVSILVYVVVLGYLLSESVRGADRWAPYGVNMPVFISLIIGSEVAVTATAVWIFRQDAGIWPEEISSGWREFRHGSLRGLGHVIEGAWDISIVDLRLRTRSAIAAGRLNRLAALVPLAYALIVSAGKGTPWGLQASALADVAITLVVWAFMEVVMVRPQSDVSETKMNVAASSFEPGVNRQSRYKVRRVSEGDITRLSDIERIRWRAQAATPDLIRSRLRRYPQGQLAAVHVSVEGGHVRRETVVAWCTVMAGRWEKVQGFTSWDQVTGNGTIANCEPRGNVLVGVNLTSVTEGATYILLGEILASVVQWGKARMIGGARLNGYASFNERRHRLGRRPFTADEYARLQEIRGYHIAEQRLDDGDAEIADDEYVRLVNNIRLLNGETPMDPDVRPDYVCSNLRGYLSIPGARLVAVTPNYFPDEASDNWGVVIDWVNPLPRALRPVPLLRTYVAKRIRQEVLSEWESRRQGLIERSRRRAAPARTVEAPERTPAAV